jgi:paraquat-inducible protein B
MTDHDDLDNIPQAVVVPKKRMRFSAVWIIPVVAALVALGIWVQRIMSEGPTITIVFKEATGMEAGKTHVKYKDVGIGLVKSMKLSDDFTKVELTVKIDKSAAGLLVEDAKFWIEQPRATLSGVSGIGTLLSGNYIGLEPGKSGKARREFTGLEAPPTITFDQPGRRFVLQTATLGSIGSGTPLYYRQLNVGQVTGYDLAEDGGSVKIEVFVRAPYDKYVTDETRFWQASGVDVSLGAEGVSVRTQSFLSMLIGGIAFETPPSIADLKPSAERAVFTLYHDRKTAMAPHETIVTPYVLYPNEPLRGLAVGAPVTYLGLAVGEVTAVGLEYKAETNDVRPRVDFVVYLRRFLTHLKDPSSAEEKSSSIQERRAFIQRMVDRGMRAQLRSGSLVTGQLYVALDMYPNASRAKVDWTKTPQELPMVPSGLQDLQNKVNSILAKIEKMPLDGIGTDLKKLLGTIDSLLKRVDGEIVPDVKKALEDLQRTLKSTDATLVGKDAPAPQELREALQEVRRAAQAVSGLIEYLERNPDALLRGKTQEKPQ